MLTLDDPPANTYSYELTLPLDADVLQARMDGQEPFAEELALERELQQRLFESADARAGIAAYLEKRKPGFDGR